MNVREEKERNTDRVWNELYQRLERDGLLVSTTTGEQRSVGLSAWVRVAGIAALFIGFVSIFMLVGRKEAAPADTLVVHNAQGDPTLVTSLGDGSIVYLAGQASIEYPARFTGGKREVTLQGDAFFEVSKNREYPFIIHTRAAVVEVLGTSFQVKDHDTGAFSLSVRTGKVKVTSRKDRRCVYVGAGETALLEDAGLRTLPTGDRMRFGNYLRHIHFKDQRLADVIRVINENTDSVQLKIAPELGDRRINVTFLNDTPETMARIICLGLNLQYTRQQNIIHITQPD